MGSTYILDKMKINTSTAKKLAKKREYAPVMNKSQIKTGMHCELIPLDQLNDVLHDHGIKSLPMAYGEVFTKRYNRMSKSSLRIVDIEDSERDEPNVQLEHITGEHLWVSQYMINANSILDEDK